MRFSSSSSVERSRLARDPVMIHRVGPVGPNLHLENRIRAFTRDSFDRNANRSQIFGKLPVIDRHINKFANPLVKRVSFASHQGMQHSAVS